MKRTTIVTCGKGAVGWASSYCDEVKKHKGKVKFADGIEVGRTYFTSRPPGTLSVHGYGRSRVEALARSKGVSGNAAVIDYLREHCWRQKQKGRKIMGIRLILRMDPAKVTELLRDQVDIDRLLVRVAEDTFSSVAQKFYPGDEFCFIMGLHHDARVHGNKAWVKHQKREGTYKELPHHPHIHAHVFLLPQTKKGLRLSLSNGNYPGRDGIRVDPLSYTIATYQENIQRQVYDLSIQPHPRIGTDWEALIREAAMSAANDFYNAEIIEDPKAKIKFALDKFAYHMMSMDRESLRKRHAQRRQEFLNYSITNKEQLRVNVAGMLNDQDEIFRGNIGRRSKEVSDLFDRFNAPIIPQPVKFWDLPSQKAIILAPGAKKVTLPPNRSLDITQTMRELEDLRRASQMQNLAELTEIEMKLSALQVPGMEPEWNMRLPRFDGQRTGQDRV